MGIWIRNQDGGLGKYTKFLPPVISYKEIPDPESIVPTVTDEVLSVSVYGCDMNGGVDILGTYSTEAEALQVINMIEAELGNLRVFRMPEAGFSEKYDGDPYAGHEEID